MRRLVNVSQLLWDETAFERPLHHVLFESLRRSGFRVDGPLPYVMPCGDGYLVIGGRRITQAAAILGITEITCDVVEPMTGEKIKIERIKESTPPYVQKGITSAELDAIADRIVDNAQKMDLTTAIQRAEERLAVKMIEAGCKQAALRAKIGNTIGQKFWKQYAK